jgi:hypothetical protein
LGAFVLRLDPRLHGLLREDALAAGTRTLRRDRELAFYAAEDLTPSGFYTRVDATAARDIARKTVAALESHVTGVE